MEDEPILLVKVKKGADMKKLGCAWCGKHVKDTRTAAYIIGWGYMHPDCTTAWHCAQLDAAIRQV